MACVLYRCGDEVEVRGVMCVAGRFPANQVQKRKDEGWVSDPLTLYQVQTEEEADTNETGVLSNKEVRSAAQIAGFEDWETARIGKLKERLGYGDR